MLPTLLISLRLSFKTSALVLQYRTYCLRLIIPMFEGSFTMNSSSDLQYFIGLMSGTSTDGVDGALVAFSTQTQPHIVAFKSIAMPESLRETFLSLNKSGNNELEKAAIAANQLAQLYSHCVYDLLKSSDITATQVTAIGAHGQTVRHRPDLNFTIQLNAPALLAELTNIDVIADFRSRDVAAGGQGAPFAPLLHEALFRDAQKKRVILNLGGIANITVLTPNQPLLGFDTGPANALMDYWVHLYRGENYDENGAWGATGNVLPGLLEDFLDDPYFNLPAPKSTGRDLFNPDWLTQHLQAFASLRPEDVMATLRALTTHSIASAIKRYQSDIDELIVCGGGSKNTALIEELKTLLQCDVNPIDNYGYDSQAIEALAFAWLAKAFVHKEALNFPALTGSEHRTIAGAYYPR